MGKYTIKAEIVDDKGETAKVEILIVIGLPEGWVEDKRETTTDLNQKILTSKIESIDTLGKMKVRFNH